MTTWNYLQRYTNQPIVQPGDRILTPTENWLVLSVSNNKIVAKRKLSNETRMFYVKFRHDTKTYDFYYVL